MTDRLSLRRASLLFASLAVALVVACGGDDEGNGQSAVCEDATMHSDLAWIQANIFTPSCANSASCHRGAALSAGMLNLETGNSEAAMVNVPSDVLDGLGLPAMDIVEPGMPSQSYLTVLLRGTPQSLLDPEVGAMPQQSDLLCAEKVAAVERWIMGLPASVAPDAE